MPSNRRASSRPRKLIIAIDGPAGSGKSTTAKALARRLGLPYLDTGAMYRAITYQAMTEGVPFDDKKRLVALAKSAEIRFEDGDGLPLGAALTTKQRVFLNGAEVTEAIRTPELTKNVFHVAQEPRIRREMVKKQRRMGRECGGVMEGRDIGTVVFPKADFKFYFDASSRVRALRRYRELRVAGKRTTLKEVLRDIIARDKTDYERRVGALRQAEDALRIDTSPLTIEGTVAKILKIIRSRPIQVAKAPRAMHRMTRTRAKR